VPAPKNAASPTDRHKNNPEASVKKSLINELTKDQERELVEFRERMWRQGTACLPVDRVTATKAIADAYAVIKRPPPKMFWMPSPMTAVLALYVLRKLADEAQKPEVAAALRAGLRAGLGAGLGDGLRDGLRAGLGDGLGAGLRDGLGAGLWDGLWAGLRDGLWDGLRDGLGAGLWAGLGAGLDLYGRIWPGQVDTYWLAFYRFGSMIGCPQRESLLERLDIMERIVASCGFWFPRDGVCIVSDRFAGVSWDNSRNRQGLPIRLHHDAKHAVSFRDGWGLYYWHGLRIPPSHEWLFTERAKLAASSIDKEPNAELRRIMLEIYGFDRYCAEREAKVIAADDLHGQPRRLLEVTVAGEPVRIVEVINGSLEPDGTRRKFHLGAARAAGSRTPPKTPDAAIANSYGIAPKHYREAVRT
jgi:hypothetical protein